MFLITSQHTNKGGLLLGTHTSKARTIYFRFFIRDLYLQIYESKSADFFKRGIYVLVFAALIGAIYYSIVNFAEIDMSTIGSYLANGFVGLMMVLMVVVIGGFLLRSVWTGIMNRVDRVVLCCPDKNHDGIHIVAGHYNAGGESESFYNYFHYYLDGNGKLYLSKKVENEGREIVKSVVHLSEQTRLQLEPDRRKAVEVGSYKEDDKPTSVTVPFRKGELHFLGYEGLIDYGFKVVRRVNGRAKWRVRI